MILSLVKNSVRTLHVSRQQKYHFRYLLIKLIVAWCSTKTVLLVTTNLKIYFRKMISVKDI